MATIRTWPVALALLLVLPAAAEASYKYTATIRFAGTYSSDEYDAGVLVGHTQSKTTFTLRDPRLVVTAKAGAIAMHSSGRTAARLSAVQSGSGSPATPRSRPSPTASRSGRAAAG